jgi:hypothetical protein
MTRPPCALLPGTMFLLAAAALAGEVHAQGAPPAAPSTTAAPPAGTLQQLPPAPPPPATTAPPAATTPTYPAPAPPRYGTYPPSAYPPGYTPPVYQPQQPQPQPQVPYPQQAAPAYPYGYNPFAAWPATLPAVDGKQPPNGYREETSVRKSFVITGAVAFGVFYLSSLAAASVLSDSSTTDSSSGSSSSNKSDSEALPLFIPCLGPFIGLATLDPAPVGTAWLVLDGLAQTAGLTLLIVGIAYPNKKWVRMDLASASVQVAPIVTPTHSGLGLFGRF